ncbi:MAG TPA: hypothetical protein VG889_13755 [Rhizomicrobium sp.]|nr:hypothetical protein [Rhizomicrobium sp.]
MADKTNTKPRGKKALGTDGGGGADYSKRLYVIGDKETGVLFVTVDPLRVAYVGNDDIAAYAGAGSPPEEIFARIAGAIKSVIICSEDSKTKLGIGTGGQQVQRQVESGVTVSDAEFCFVANMKDGRWEAKRQPFPPLYGVLNYMRQAKAPTYSEPGLVKPGKTAPIKAKPIKKAKVAKKKSSKG